VLSDIFYDKEGHLSTSFEFLANMDGVMDRLFPGYGCFESSLDERVLIEKTEQRGVWVREKLKALEGFLAAGAALAAEGRTAWDAREAHLSEIVAIESEKLDGEYLAAVRLAIVCKRLPVTADDVVSAGNIKLKLHRRFASGFSRIPLDRYFAPFVGEGGFRVKAVRVAEFLIAHRRAFKERAEAGANDQNLVTEFVKRCGDEATLNALFVFTCADRLMGLSQESFDRGEDDAGLDREKRVWREGQWDGSLWFHTRELYVKALENFRPEILPDPSRVLRAAGYGKPEEVILRDFGPALFGGLYLKYSRRFGFHLVALAAGEVKEPKVVVVRDGGLTLLVVAGLDFPGLAACISGAIWKRGIKLRRAHLFCASTHGLAFDFFHLDTGGGTLPDDLEVGVVAAICEQLHTSSEDEAALPPLKGKIALTMTSPGRCCLRYETDADGAGLIYALACKINRRLGGSIHSLVGYSRESAVFVVITHSLPKGMALEDAMAIVENW
jgi:hypothetical protein